MKKLKIILITAGIMTSLSFVNCYAMGNNENIMQKNKNSIICFTEEELEKLIKKKEMLENDEKKFKEKSILLNNEIDNLKSEIENLKAEQGEFRSKIVRIKNEKEWYKHLYGVAETEKIILECKNRKLIESNKILKKELESAMKNMIEKNKNEEEAEEEYKA